MSEFKLSKFDQIGIVVKDIEKVAKLFSLFLNFKAKINIVEQTTKVMYKGIEATFKMKKIMQNFGEKQLEIIELLESKGNHLYLEFLKEGNSGLHHLGVYVKQPEKLVTQFKKELNIDVIQIGKAGRVKFYYLDTKEVLGFYLELIAF